MAKDFLKEMFINEAKPALDRHSGSGGEAKIVNTDAISWIGTPIPNDGTVVDGFYLNTKLASLDLQNDDDMKKLSRIYTNMIEVIENYSVYIDGIGNVYPILLDSNTMDGYILLYNNDYDSGLNVMYIMRINTLDSTDMTPYFRIGVIGWSVGLEYFNENTDNGHVKLSSPTVTSDIFAEELPIGLANDKLTEIISLTPFEDYISLSDEYLYKTLNITERECTVDLFKPLLNGIFYGKIDVNAPVPSGEIAIDSNGIYDVTEYAQANVNIHGVPSGEILIDSNGTYDVAQYAYANVNVPDPSGEILIDSNGTYDVAQYSHVNVNISYPEGKYTSLKSVLSVLGARSLNDNTVFLIKDSDIEDATNFSSMYFNCSSATSFPLIDTSKGTDFHSMYYGCSSATSFPLIDTSKGTDFHSMYYNCSSATEFPALNVSMISSITFYSDGLIDMYFGCSSATSILMYGMKVNFSINDCIKLEAPALVTIISNCQVVSSETLTMGSTLLNKLDGVYVKLTGKELYEGITCNPCVICDSTDEGAMTVQEYATLKGWTLA